MLNWNSGPETPSITSMAGRLNGCGKCFTGLLVAFLLTLAHEGQLVVWVNSFSHWCNESLLLFQLGCITSRSTMLFPFSFIEHCSVSISKLFFSVIWPYLLSDVSTAFSPDLFALLINLCDVVWSSGTRFYRNILSRTGWIPLGNINVLSGYNMTKWKV